MPNASTRMTHTTMVNIFFVHAAASRRSLFCCAVNFWFVPIDYNLNLPRISMMRAMFLATSTPTFHLFFSYSAVPFTMVMRMSAPLQVLTTAETGSVVGV